MGITLVSGLALAMGAGAAPAVALVAPASSVKAAFIATPEVDLGDGVSVTGPAKPFKDDASGAYWYKEGGKFTLKVSTPSINKVSVTVNGETVIDEDLGVAGPDTFEKDFEITANSEIKINVTHGSVMGADKQSADKKLPDTKAADTVIKESVDPKTGKTTPEKVVPGEVIPGKTVKGALVAGEPTAASVMLKSMVTNFDTTAPVTSGTATEVGQDAGKSYVGANSVFTASAVDGGIGLGSLVLEKFDAATNTWVKSRDVVNETGFKLTVSGKYRLFSTDLLGNTSAHTFADVFGVSEDVIYVAPAAGGVDYTVNGAPNTKGFYVDAAKVAVVFKGSFTTSTKIIVNGVATTNKGWDFNSADRTFNIDLKNVARAGDGVYKIHAETTALGGKTTSADYVVKADFDAPTIDNATLDGQYEVSGNVIYAGAGAVVSFDVNDVGSGLKSVTVAGAAVTVSSDGSRKSFTLKSGQDYAITATDAVGHTTTRRLTQLGLPSNSVVVDPTAPVMKETAVVDPNYTTSPGDKWYVKAPVSQWTVTDDNLKSVQVDVNGQVDTLKPNSAGVYAVDLAGYPLADGNRLSVTVIASDKSGNVTKEVRTLFIDGDAPVDLQADVEGSYQDTDSGVYSRTPLRLNASANDGAGTGIQTYQLLDSTGKVVSEFADGVLNIPSGNHSIVVVDFNGNKSAPVTLQTLLGTKSNNFVYDDTAPTLVESKPTKPGYTAGNGDKWYVTAPKSSWDVKDENLKSVEITVNGKTETFKPNDAGIYSVDLKNYALQDGNKLSISVVATDLANNITRNNSVLFVDGDAPRDLQATVDGAYQDRDFGVYAQSPLVLSAKSNDGVGIGIKTYQLVDTEGKVVSEFSKGTIEIPQGQYRVVVVDLLGNKSAPQTLQSLLGLKTNIFNYDSTAPKISVDRRDANHQNWFGSDVDYTVNYSDNLALYSGTVSVNGKELGNFTSGGVETGHSLKFSTSQADANEDGSYNIVANGTDAAGNPVSWSETVKVDRDAPSIQSFTFTASGYKEGEALSKSDEYGFFFQDATSVDIKTEDLGPSSGVKEITYVLRNDNGSEFKQGIVPVDGNSARVDIPVGFKGYIDASATDFVAHTGETRHPSGVITEDRNWYMNTSDIQIQLADPGNRDTKNQFLYRGDAVATVPIKQGVSGIKSVQWGIGDTTLGDTTVAIDGSMTGTGFTVDERGKNLVLGVTGNLPINGNANDMRVWVKVTDRAGYTSDADKTVSIDKDAPVIDVSYNDTNPTSYYAADRTATVTITERNFDPKDVKWTGKYGSLGNWQNVGGDVWRASIVFSEETEYAWGVSYTDLAGNAGNSYESETFTVDKTAPQLSVTFDNNSVQNGKFYKAARTAVVEVIDRNFDASKVAYAGDGALGGWSSNGDLHTATVSFGTDGAYKFNVGSTDKAGNASNSFDSGDFTVDTTKPAFAIEGVKNGVSYKKDVGFTVTTSDTYVDTKASFVTLTGRKNGKMEVEGGFNESTGNFEIKNFPNEKEFDDLYTLSAKVVDLAGNEVAEDVVFSVNRFGSDFKFQTEDLNGEYFQKLPSDIVLTQTSVDQLDMNGFSVVVLRNGEKIEVPKAAWNVKESGGGESNWVYTITVNKDFFKEDGAYQVQMFSKATDGTQESSMSQEYAFVIDNTKPVIYISGVEDKTVYKALEKDVTVEVRDLSGVAELSILLNDVEQPYTEENGVYKITIPANSKNNDIYVEAKDRAGNMERVGVVDFYLTSSEFEAMWQKSWVRWLAVTVGVLFAMVLALILRGAIKRRKEEDERQTRLDAAQAASSGHLDNTSGAIADVNMDIPVEDAYLETGIAGAAGASAAPTPSESGGVAEDDQATDFIDEGNGSTEHFDEGDGSTGYFTDGGNDNK